jgi:hypothetical protein
MHGIFCVPPVTNPYQIGYYQHSGATTPPALNYDMTSSSGNNDTHARSFSLTTGNVAVNRMVIASPYKWQ